MDLLKKNFFFIKKNKEHKNPFQKTFGPALAFISLALRDCGRISAPSGLHLTFSFQMVTIFKLKKAGSDKNA
jgi:hypothetical protein